MTGPPAESPETSPTAQPPPRRRRRWWALSLRALMIAVLVVGGGLGWLARRAHLQRRAVAALTARGGRFTYDWAVRDPATMRPHRTDPPGPRWLRRWVGDEFFQEVAQVQLRRPATPDGLTLVTEFDHLQALNIQNASTLDDGLGRLAGLTSLKTLSIGGSVANPSLSDASLAPVGRLASLETVLIYQATITDAGLDSLAGLRRLRSLSLVGCSRVTSAGVARLLDQHPLLETLNLSWTPVDDTVMPLVGRLPHLRAVWLANTKITDAGLSHLGRLGKLTTLDLSRTDLTDAGVPALANLTILGELSLYQTAVTPLGAAEFARLRPTVRVGYRPKRGPSGRVPSGAGTAPAQPLPPGTVNDRPNQPTPADRKITVESENTGPQGNKGVLARLRDKHRPVVVFAPSGDDNRATRQRNAWVGPLPEAGIKDRDIVVVEVLGSEGKAGDQPVTADEARELRMAFGVADGAFAVVLVGRDGTEKARWDDPVSPQEVFGRIDSMPMRQAEVEQKGGH